MGYLKEKINWLKKLLKIVRNHETEIMALQNQINWYKQTVENSVKLIKERTSINVDVGFKGRSQIIVIGRYNGADYIQTYTVNEKDFTGLVRQLVEMQRYGVVEKIDYIPHISASIKQELKHWE